MILNKNNPETIQILSRLMVNGATAILPCDTIYGLCSVYGLGEKALRDIKGRNENKPFLILATKEQAIELCTHIPEDILNMWPAPCTVILNHKDGGTIGIRVPDDEFLIKVLENIGKPLYSTSVNISGEPALLDFSEISNRFEALVDVCVKGQEIQGTVPSTILDATSKPYRVLRKGSFDVSNLACSC